MSRGVNKFIGIGTLGQDPEVRHNASGNAMANISIAVNESWADKQTGEKKEKTEWIRIVFFGKLAEIVGEYLKKGSKVYVEGKLQTRKWTDKEGNDKWTTEIVANQMQMIGDRHSNNSQNTNQSQHNTPAPQQREPGDDDFNSDVPF